MNVDAFLVDDENEEKFASHGLTADQVTQVLENDYLVVEAEGECLRLKKLSPAKTLSPEDPIWSLIGKGSSGSKDGSVRHDHYLAEGERKRWRRS